MLCKLDDGVVLSPDGRIWSSHTSDLPSLISRNSIPFLLPDLRILFQDNSYPLKKKERGMKMER